MKQSQAHKAPVLIVDDEQDICFLLNTILRQKDIDTCLAGSLAEAQKIIENDSPAMIFLDNHLPDGLGLDHISKLKQKSPCSKIVMITAHDNPAERERAYREGADFFISKPFTKDVIYNTLRQLSVE
ncbi:MAG TPA: response regulator [Chitinophagaceae bacterium]|jgi:DNA-binding NtrC family response regulator|nr:response regulator [Chitinophagaceae bacterium]